MDVKQAYNSWAQQYDTNANPTRDLEGIALRTTLNEIPCQSVLEIGCGTGKNTEWLATKASHVTAVDLSEEMLALARQKVQSAHVVFKPADITQPWHFANGLYDLISFSLVLEHIENLYFIFEQAALHAVPGGHLYIGELHPFKQYTGSKARFETEGGTQVVPCFNHNMSDFTGAAKKHGFALAAINEYFDNNDRTLLPRILTLLFKKSS
jgi:2-polyprenyl-3-methyl-5-hydroxy-6-metoxy-1,4-benzoquinol methylase